MIYELTEAGHIKVKCRQVKQINPDLHLKVEKTFFSVLLLCLSNLAWSQTYTQIQPQQADGFPIFKVSIILMNDSSKSAIEMNDSAEMKRFYKAFGIQPGAIFNEFIMDAAIKRIVKEPNVKSVDLELYNSQFSSSVWIKLIVAIQDTIKKAEVIGKKSGMLTKEGLKDFPVIYENDRSKLTFILNGSSGIFNEENAFLSEGSAFTQGNPIANDPAGRGVRFWQTLKPVSEASFSLEKPMHIYTEQHQYGRPVEIHPIYIPVHQLYSQILRDCTEVFF